MESKQASGVWRGVVYYRGGAVDVAGEKLAHHIVRSRFHRRVSHNYAQTEKASSQEHGHPYVPLSVSSSPSPSMRLNKPYAQRIEARTSLEESPFAPLGTYADRWQATIPFLFAVGHNRRSLLQPAITMPGISQVGRPCIHAPYIQMHASPNWNTNICLQR